MWAKTQPPASTKWWAMNSLDWCVVFSEDSRLEWSADASTLQLRRKPWSSSCGYFVLYSEVAASGVTTASMTSYGLLANA